MRLAFALTAALIAVTGTANAAPLSCPAELAADESAGGTEAAHKFRYVSFFDGDPSEMVNLAPEEGPNPKVLEQRWQLSRTAGRPIVMLCRYHGTDRTVRQEVPSDVQECRLNGFIDAAGEIIGSPTLECG